MQALPSWSAEDQEADALAWCAEHGYRAVVYRATEVTFETFVKAVRESEVAVFADLRTMIPPPRQRGKSRPGLLFAVAVGRLLKRAGAVAEVRSNALSTDDRIWLPAHEAAVRRVTSGRKKLPRQDARKMQGRSVEARNSTSPLAKWRGEKERNSRKYRQARAVWRSRDFSNAAEAQAALPEELHSVSRTSLERLFGGRTK